MKRMDEDLRQQAIGGLAGWLMEKWKRRNSAAQRPHLELVERIQLAPRQTLALVEADGRRLLVATSPDGSPAFFDLAADQDAVPAPKLVPVRKAQRARVSW